MQIYQLNLSAKYAFTLATATTTSTTRARAVSPTSWPAPATTTSVASGGLSPDRRHGRGLGMATRSHTRTLQILAPNRSLQLSPGFKAEAASTPEPGLFIRRPARPGRRAPPG